MISIIYARWEAILDHCSQVSWLDPVPLLKQTRYQEKGEANILPLRGLGPWLQCRVDTRILRQRLADSHDDIFFILFEMVGTTCCPLYKYVTFTIAPHQVENKTLLLP